MKKSRKSDVYLHSEDTSKSMKRGSVDNPYTLQEYEQLYNTNFWLGGYVENLGYLCSETTDSNVLNQNDYYLDPNEIHHDNGKLDSRSNGEDCFIFSLYYAIHELTDYILPFETLRDSIYGYRGANQNLAGIEAIFSTYLHCEIVDDSFQPEYDYEHTYIVCFIESWQTDETGEKFQQWHTGTAYRNEGRTFYIHNDQSEGRQQSIAVSHNRQHRVYKLSKKNSNE